MLIKRWDSSTNCPQKKKKKAKTKALAKNFSFHKRGTFEKSLNATFIALIPKKERGRDVKDFKLISIEVSGYKILAEVLQQIQECDGWVVNLLLNTHKECKFDTYQKKKSGKFEKSLNATFITLIQKKVGGERWKGCQNY